MTVPCAAGCGAGCAGGCGGGSRLPVLHLTDEELAVLAAEDRSPVLLPHLLDVPADQRQFVELTAFRGLVARGVVASAAPTALAAPTASAASTAATGAAAGDELPAETLVEVVEPVGRILAVRRDARAVVCVRRTLADGPDYRYFHVGSEGLLDESVSAAGLHRLALRSPGASSDDPDAAPVQPDAVVALLVDVLVEHVLDPGADGKSGAPVELTSPLTGADPAGRPDVRRCLEQLGAATVVADVAVRRLGDDGPGTLVGVFSGPPGIVLSENRYGSDHPVQVRSASRGDVATALAALLGPAVGTALANAG